MLQNELIAAYEAGERTVASELPLEHLQTPLTADQLHRVNRFLEFARQKCCRAAPARPTTEAAYVLHEHAEGTSAQQILALLDSIAAFHDHHGLANPVATAVVRLALDDVIRIEPPRSWPKEDKVLFATLPPDIRSVIARREQERDASLRRKQNELAEQTKRLTTEAATNSVNNIDTKGNSNNEEIQRRQCEARPGN
jgi:hypothetical protein